MTEPGTKAIAPRDGVWAVVDPESQSLDFLAVVAVFSTEVPALRFAVGSPLIVMRLKYGDDLRHEIAEDLRGQSAGGEA